MLLDCTPVRLTHSTTLKNFDCGNADLNEFLMKDSVNYSRHLLSVTYLFENPDEIVAFYSVSNDKIIREEINSRSMWDRLTKSIPWEKRHKQLPAVKIGRLGVNSKYQKSGIGSQLLDAIKVSFTRGNKTGCRFITVDAYNNPKTLNFYQRNDFVFLTSKDEKDETRHMYFDLIRFVEPAA